MSKDTAGAGGLPSLSTMKTGALIATMGDGYIRIAVGIGCLITAGGGPHFIMDAGFGITAMDGAGGPTRYGLPHGYAGAMIETTAGGLLCPPIPRVDPVRE